MDEIIENTSYVTLPMVALRDMIVYPGIVTNLDIGRIDSIASVRQASKGNRMFVGVMQKDGKIEAPEEGDLYRYGTLIKIRQMLQLPGGLIRILVEGVSRVTVKSIKRTQDYVTAEFEKVKEIYPEDNIRAEAYRRVLLTSFFEWMQQGKISLSEEQTAQLRSMSEVGSTVDFIAQQLIIPMNRKQDLLETLDVMERLKAVQKYIDDEIQIGRMEAEINGEVRTRMEKEQRDYFLRQKIKSIHDKLGDRISQEQEAEEYRKKLAKSGIPEESKAKIEKEISHLETMPPMMAETAIVRNYLEWIMGLPWKKESKDKLDLHHAKKMLDKEHFGLEKIKEHILEYLAVRILAPNAKAPIICFVGPPGVGKTSLAQSIADAMGRKFPRISLGGLHDEAEIRGHRRTYIGAMPGRFIEAINQAKTKNPLILLDEIDKVGSDFRGDPASALLEALDPEQNKAFHDNYIDIPFDFSKVFFIATANTLSTIPAALLDRMEVISISGYTEDEKLEIAKRYLVPRQKEMSGLKNEDVRFTPALIRKIIRSYTREAGVRELERTIGTLCRKVAKKIVLKDEELPNLTSKTIIKYLGAEKFMPMSEEHESIVGRVNGLAWTAVGGEVLDTEAVTIKGKGRLILTGQLGDVMKESAETAYTYIRSRAKKLGLKENFYESLDTHIHLPEGAVPKDGPSAGITMATAMASIYTGRKVRGDTAMTGEITLTGEVLPIGGLKEKLLAAKQFGIKQVLIPIKNKRDLVDMPKNIQEGIDIIFVKNVEEVLAHALMK